MNMPVHDVLGWLAGDVCVICRIAKRLENRSWCESCTPAVPSDEEFRRADEERQAKARAKEMAAMLATIPENFRDLTLDSPELAKCVRSPIALELGRRSLRARKLVFLGPAGSGKTSLAAAMLHARIEQDERRYRYVAAYRLGTARIQAPAGEGEPAIVANAMSVGLVLLDEVGGERHTQTNAVPDVIYERYDAGLATWITTGLSVQAVKERYGDGIARRIFEGATIIDLGAK